MTVFNKDVENVEQQQVKQYKKTIITLHHIENKLKTGEIYELKS